MSSLPCPAYQVLRLLAGKWKPAILFHLRAQTLRFGDLRRCLPEVSQKVLTAQLKELESEGKLLEAQRLEQRTNFDLEMIAAT